MTGKPKWKSRLVNRVRGSDRLVVWDYDRVPDHKKLQRVTLCEVTDENEIQDLLDRIEIDVPASTGRCRCLGSPLFDFMAGDRVRASISLHHGTRLRWKNHWRADAQLTRASQFEVCGWFKERGVIRPWHQLHQEVNRSLAYQRRAFALRKILPEAFVERFLRLQDDGEVLELFRASRESRSTLAGWCLRILGCDNGSWEHIDYLTHANDLATQVMPLLGRRACGIALRRGVIADHDQDACYGAARVLFYFGGWESFSKASLNDSMPTLIRAAMRHPRRRNRQYVMWVLSQLEGGDEPLHWILTGESTPESISPDQATEPDGFLYTRGLAPNEPVDVSDQAYAAWLLGGMGVVREKGTIEHLAEDAKGPDKKVLERALEALGS